MPVLGPAPVDDYSDSDERSSGEDSDSSDDSDCSNDDSDSEGVPGSPGDNAVSLIQPPWLLQLPAHTCARLCCAATDTEDLLQLAHAHRHRMVIIALAALNADRTGTGTEHCKPAGFTWAAHVEKLGERDFKLRYRMDAESFYALLDILRPGLQFNERQQSRARSGLPIEPETRLAAALRYFAGGSPHDLKLIYDNHVSGYPLGCLYLACSGCDQQVPAQHQVPT